MSRHINKYNNLSHKSEGSPAARYVRFISRKIPRLFHKAGHALERRWIKWVLSYFNLFYLIHSMSLQIPWQYSVSTIVDCNVWFIEAVWCISKLGIIILLFGTMMICKPMMDYWLLQALEMILKKHTHIQDIFFDHDVVCRMAIVWFGSRCVTERYCAINDPNQRMVCAY